MKNNSTDTHQRTDQFCFMYQGKLKKNASAEDLRLLEPVYQSTSNPQRALLCLHGFGSSPAVFRYLHPLLSPLFDTIYSPKLPGHGESVQAFNTVRYTDWIKASQNAFCQLQKNHTHISVLGLSLGGLLAYDLAHDYPVDHLYLLAPAFALKLPTRLISVILSLLSLLGVHSIKNRAGDIYASDYAELTYRYLPNHAILELFKYIQGIKKSPLSCPIDLFLGSHDHVVDNKTVLNELSGEKKLSTHILNQSAHALPLENEYPLIASIIARSITVPFKKM